MSNHTPTRSEIVSALVAYRLLPGTQTPIEIAKTFPAQEVAAALDGVERGLAELERAAGERALRQAADALEVFSHPTERFSASAIAADLRRRATAYRLNEGEKQ